MIEFAEEWIERSGVKEWPDRNWKMESKNLFGITQSLGYGYGSIFEIL